MFEAQSIGGSLGPTTTVRKMPPRGRRSDPSFIRMQARVLVPVVP